MLSNNIAHILQKSNAPLPGWYNMYTLKLSHCNFDTSESSKESMQTIIGYQTGTLLYYKSHRAYINYICVSPLHNTCQCTGPFGYFCQQFNYMLNFMFCSLQEVGSIIGKKGEIVKRFREEVSYSIFKAFLYIYESFTNKDSIQYYF